jgi:hypothetical protein
MSLDLSAIENAFLIKVESGLDEETYLDRLTQNLALKIESLLRNDMEKLLWILYRIDVKDNLVDEAMSLGEVKKIAGKLAHLVIERQLKKINYRKENQ